AADAAGNGCGGQDVLKDHCARRGRHRRMIVSYNVYNADTQEKLNMLPVPIDEDFTWDGRSSGTVYRVYTTNLDQAGNESGPSPIVEVTTDEFTPGSEMAPENRAAVDQIIADAMAAG